MNQSIFQTIYSKERFARIGQELYNKEIEPLVEPAHHGKVVGIDIQTGDYAIDEDVMPACATVKERRPEAQIWIVRAGHPTLYKHSARPRLRSVV